MIWLPETWRKERSLAYQTALKRAQSKAQERALADRFNLGGFGMGEVMTKPKQAKLEGKKEWIGMGWKSTPKVQEIGEVKVSLADANVRLPLPSPHARSQLTRPALPCGAQDSFAEAQPLQYRLLRDPVRQSILHLLHFVSKVRFGSMGLFLPHRRCHSPLLRRWKHRTSTSPLLTLIKLTHERSWAQLAEDVIRIESFVDSRSRTTVKASLRCGLNQSQFLSISSLPSLSFTLGSYNTPSRFMRS